ncbi:S-adenosyl-L-methionine-dependent methyltransferase [Basidiobolus meristosporus CBS 931.73]|uniref:S-adenosyl-L-methionine-dependent methyltransferase n=1 Tax=Basidiobolus meristosporus CBS 931.73 TaxID=1314790 RepID=A0A1Y1YXZ6_9FUNG|nr:S-adenosyl-L-methionine-dependent methyltransferase [Basidiobolus meristosporus CBS 931.73]|eukprot:ORY02903.1 S-adenosyl-L-methionine-dependent methyltransferase [Basidiobolus meristosporus CBS 931.73]
MQFKKVGVWILSILAALLAVLIADHKLETCLIRNQLFNLMWDYMGPGVDECLTPTKLSLLKQVTGKVVELGPGHGSNFKYFAKNSVTKVYAVEPNLSMHPKLSSTAKDVGLDVEIIGALWENSNLERGSFDTVVSNLVLCSVNDLQGSLDLIQDYLRPGGVFLFIEHVAQPNGTAWRTAQNLINPFWKYIGDNCQVNRETGMLLKAMQGWKEVSIESEDLCGGMGLVNPKIYGYAIKA